MNLQFRNYGKGNILYAKLHQWFTSRDFGLSQRWCWRFWSTGMFQGVERSVANPDPAVRSSGTIQWRILYPSAGHELRTRIRHCNIPMHSNFMWLTLLAKDNTLTERATHTCYLTMTEEYQIPNHSQHNTKISQFYFKKLQKIFKVRHKDVHDFFFLEESST